MIILKLSQTQEDKDNETKLAEQYVKKMGNFKKKQKTQREPNGNPETEQYNGITENLIECFTVDWISQKKKISKNKSFEISQLEKQRKRMKKSKGSTWAYRTV